MTAEATPLTLPLLAASAMKILMSNPLFKVAEAQIRGNSYRVFENIPNDLGAYFAQSAGQYADKDFIVYKGERYSFGEIHQKALRFADGMARQYGVKAGDHVAIAMRNYPEFCIAYVGLASMGAVVVPLNAWWKSEELKFGAQDSQAKIVIVDGRRLEYMLPHKEELGLTLILARDDGEGADARFEEVIEAGEAVQPSVEIEPDAPFSIVYTSGSTGQPKGVLLTHRGALSALYSWYFIMNVLEDATGEEYTTGDLGILLSVPLFHVTGSHSIFMISWLLGRRMVIQHRWDAEEAAKLINDEKLTHFVGVPSQGFELMRAAGNDGLSTLRDVGSGGAKRPPDQVKKIADSFAGATASSGYGLSETNALGSVISRELYQQKPGSTGRAVPPLTDLRIVKDGKDQPKGEVGEVWIRTPGNFAGYWNRPEETEKSITEDGWFRSGDLGYLDDEDFLFIVDRIKDIIIRGGENISCLDVEGAAYEHGDVAEAAAFSVPCDVLGERVGLVVYPKEGQTIDAQHLHDFMAEHHAGYKVPERIWISPAALPRLGTEKFDKLTVKRIALQHPPALSV